MSRRYFAASIALPLVLIASAAAAQHQAAAAPKDPTLSVRGMPNVYDARNRLVGHVVGYVGGTFYSEGVSTPDGTTFLTPGTAAIGQPMIRFRAGTTDFYLAVGGGDGGSPLNGNFPLYFETTDCSGTPFASSSGVIQGGGPDPVIADTPVALHGWLVYARASGPETTILAASTRDGFFCSRIFDDGFNNVAASVLVVPVKRVIDLGPQKWRTPFRVE